MTGASIVLALALIVFGVFVVWRLVRSWRDTYGSGDREP
jgi:uncharacterized membrane protein